VILTSNNNDDVSEQSTITQPAFLYYDKQQDKIKTAPYIVRSNRIFKPVDEEEYQYLAYAYDMDIDEANMIKKQIENDSTSGPATSGPATSGPAIGGNSTSNSTSIPPKSPF
jgi:hypothetical protein